ncbi:excitatory amino acid transporter-like protein 2 [Sarcoptes scabiei]|uniref:Excitatory amino acid transporter-like protein 2 n=1 Tax=Sarcoptes scabiei TaxID=52283 RepID=A0A132AKP2_SARSC|nr:excitatory amino acid transporter-like protein 2 [Sarcoptes scabiei]
MAVSKLLDLFLAAILSIYLASSVEAEAISTIPILKGATISSPPYIDENDGKFDGFLVELMDNIGRLGKFNFSLYLAPDGRYGGAGLDGTVNGLIGEVYNGKADFALADITVTEGRAKYVDFTEPFLVNQLAALMRREDAIGLENMEELVEKVVKTNPAADEAITIGSLRSGATYYLLSKSEDPIGKKLYERMQATNEESLVGSMQEGLDKVNDRGKYAFIVEASFGEHEISLNCNLTLLYDNRSLYPRKFSIALPKGSQYLTAFNEAIMKLKTENKIDELKQKYWINECDQKQVKSKV